MAARVEIIFAYKSPRIEEAGRQGAIGYLEHRSVEGNPYEPSTGQYWAWLAGWCVANAESTAFREDHPQGRKGAG